MSTLHANKQMTDVRLRLLKEGRIKPAKSGKALGKTLDDIDAEMERARERRAYFDEHWKPPRYSRRENQIPEPAVDPVTLPHGETVRAVSEGLQEILHKTGKVQERKRSLAMQSSPLAFKSSVPVGNPNDPTPQWMAKAGNVASQVVGRGDVVPLRRYRQKHVIEQHGDKLDMSKRSALERFMGDSTHAMRVAVADPNRSGGHAAPGSRLGGLGNVPQHVRDGHARHEWVWGRLPPDLQSVANALVTREMIKPDGTPFSLEDFGAHMFPSVQDKNRRWGAAAGALWALAGALVFLYRRCPVKIRARDCEALEIMG